MTARRMPRPLALAFTLLTVAACAAPPPAPPPAAPPPPASASPEPSQTSIAKPPAGASSPSPSAPLPVLAGPSSLGADDAPGKRDRLPAAVILFGSADVGGSEGLRFVPVVCSLQGKLAAGKACGAAMPATARVRTTRTANVPAILTVKRSTKSFRDEAGDRVYAAPTGPACCMYNTCADETIPYTAAGVADVPSKLLAVWPETADVDLKPQALGAADVELADGKWSREPDVKIRQALRVGGQRLVSVLGPCLSCATLWVDRGSGFGPVGELGAGADGYDILATSDADGDGHREAIVYEIWRNDYGLHVLGDDWSKPLYRYSCGNI